MKLTLLEPILLRVDGDGVYDVVETLPDAQGMMFLCPKCFAANGGPVRTHSVLVWFDGRGVLASMTPAPRWQVDGKTIDELSLAPSVHITGGCGWHGWVKNGTAA